MLLLFCNSRTYSYLCALKTTYINSKHKYAVG